MDIILDILSDRAGQLLGRASGPLHLRLLITPAVALLFAIRSGMKDVREGQPPFLQEVLTNPAQRQKLLRSGWKDIGKMVIVVFVIDTVYQIYVLHEYYIGQALLMVLALAVVPYSLARGLTTRLAKALA